MSHSSESALDHDVQKLACSGKPTKDSRRFRILEQEHAPKKPTIAKAGGEGFFRGANTSNRDISIRSFYVVSNWYAQNSWAQWHSCNFLALKYCRMWTQRGVQSVNTSIESNRMLAVYLPNESEARKAPLNATKHLFFAWTQIIVLPKVREKFSDVHVARVATLFILMKGEWHLFCSNVDPLHKLLV